MAQDLEAFHHRHQVYNHSADGIFVGVTVADTHVASNPCRFHHKVVSKHMLPHQDLNYGSIHRRTEVTIKGAEYCTTILTPRLAPFGRSFETDLTSPGIPKRHSFREKSRCISTTTSWHTFYLRNSQRVLHRAT